MSRAGNPSLREDLLDEAAEWAIAQQHDAFTEADRERFAQWQARSPAHADAWASIQRVIGTFDAVPHRLGATSRQALRVNRGRRRSLLAIGALFALPAAYTLTRSTLWRGLNADLATATGELQRARLPDGSDIVLNTHSAVNIVFDATQRTLELIEGELLVTAREASGWRSPVRVRVPAGVAEVVGAAARFSVRLLTGGGARVSVFEGEVALKALGAAGAGTTLHAGQQAELLEDGVRALGQVANSAALWERGLLLARQMPMADVIGELSRYRPGVLRCDPAVAGLRVSGAISLTDTDAALAMLAREFPVRIERHSRYWVSVAPLT